MEIINNEAIADEGKYICRLGTKTYGKRMTLYPYKKENGKDFEEISDEEYQKIKAKEEAKLKAEMMPQE